MHLDTIQDLSNFALNFSSPSNIINFFLKELKYSGRDLDLELNTAISLAYLSVANFY